MFSFCLFKSCEVFFNVLNKNGVHYGFYFSLNFSKFPSHICSFCVFGPVSARSYKIGVVIIGWLDGCLVGWLVGWLAGWLAGWLVGWLVGFVKYDGYLVQQPDHNTLLVWLKLPTPRDQQQE